MAFSNERRLQQCKDILEMAIHSVILNRNILASPVMSIYFYNDRAALIGECLTVYDKTPHIIVYGLLNAP